MTVLFGFTSMDRQKNTQVGEAEEKSRGGLSTKIHAAVDGIGNSVRLLLTAGQAYGYGQADALIEGFQADYILADKGYDSDAFVEKVRAGAAVAVIQGRKNRIEERGYDKVI